VFPGIGVGVEGFETGTEAGDPAGFEFIGK
jgi:hypothetical protein